MGNAGSQVRFAPEIIKVPPRGNGKRKKKRKGIYSTHTKNGGESAASLDLGNVSRIANRWRPPDAPLDAPHDNHHQAEPTNNARDSVHVRAPPSQPVDLTHPRAHRRQAAAEPILHALQHLTPDDAASHGAVDAHADVLDVVAHALDGRAEHVRRKSAQWE